MLNKRTRAYLFERDGACLNCGRKDRLTVDHIKPVKLGGGDEWDNLQTLCGPCNAAKGDALTDYRKVPDNYGFSYHPASLDLKIRNVSDVAASYLRERAKNGRTLADVLEHCVESAIKLEAIQDVERKRFFAKLEAQEKRAEARRVRRAEAQRR